MANINYLNQCVFDHGAIKQLPKLLQSLGIKSPFLVTDAGIKAVGILDKVLGYLPDFATIIFDKTNPNPTEAQVNVALSEYKAGNCDGFIALGGGSAMDLAKAVALLATHEGELSYFGIAKRGNRFIGKVAPLIAIPTTAGTGSEVSVGAVIVLETGAKETFVSKHLIPPIAICDPDLTLGLPPILTAATGMDAVTHCLEAVLAPSINPPAEAIGIDGLERAIGQGWLKKAVNEPTNEQARWHMMMASTEGAFAFIKGLGAAHALAHATGRIKSLNLHHGTLNALYLPHILEVIEARADSLIKDKLSRIKRAMGIDDTKSLKEFLIGLNAELGLPANLGNIGLTPSHLEDILKYALVDVAHFSNCMEFSAEDYSAIYTKALG